MSMPPQGWNAPQGPGPRYEPTRQFPPVPPAPSGPPGPSGPSGYGPVAQPGAYGPGAQPPYGVGPGGPPYGAGPGGPPYGAGPGQPPYGAGPGGQPPYGLPPRPNRTPWVVGAAILAVAAIALVLVFTVFTSDNKDEAKDQVGSPKQAVQSLINAFRDHDLDAALKLTTGSAHDRLNRLKQHGDTLDTVEGAPIANITFSIGEPQINGDTARVPVTGTFQGQSERTVIQTRKVDGAWLVSHMGLLQGADAEDGPTDPSTDRSSTPSESEGSRPSDGNTSETESSGSESSDGDSSNAAAEVAETVETFFRAVLHNDYAAALDVTTGSAHDAVAEAQADDVPLNGTGDRRIIDGSMSAASVRGDTATIRVRLTYASGDTMSGTVTCTRVDQTWKVSDLGDAEN